MPTENQREVLSEIPSKKRSNSQPVPLEAVSAVLEHLARRAGIKELAIGQDLLAPGDDGDYRLDVDTALTADGLLPVIVSRAEAAFRRAHLDVSFPLAIEDDAEALLGTRVVWCGHSPDAELGIVLACVSDALMQIMKENPGQGKSVLTIGASAG